MKKIEIEKIIKLKNIISYEFNVSEELKRFFTGKEFLIEYSENVESVPDSIAVIPFVCNVLPIIWLTDAVLIISEIDKDFYESIPKFKEGYKQMFPESRFLGELKVDKIVCNNYENTSNAAMFYSGGLDSAQTFITHYSENPTLISIWGSDVRYDNVEGWEKVHKIIRETAERFCLSNIVIRSTFRKFDCEGELDRTFAKQLKDGWWHGVKHGIALLGHVAPYAYLYKVSKFYIASSNCEEDGEVRCASNPIIDNYVEFAGCKVVHDGFEYNRQDKISNIVEFCKKTQKKLDLHVCWETQKGSNCCKCEKCYRTIAGLLVEGANPKEYGFEKYELYLHDMRRYIIEVERIKRPRNVKGYWTYIQKHAIKNQKMLRKKAYYKTIKWILTADFEHPDNLKMPFLYRLRKKICLKV